MEAYQPPVHTLQRLGGSARFCSHWKNGDSSRAVPELFDVDDCLWYCLPGSQSKRVRDELDRFLGERIRVRRIYTGMAKPEASGEYRYLESPFFQRAFGTTDMIDARVTRREILYGDAQSRTDAAISTRRTRQWLYEIPQAAPSSAAAAQR